MHLHRHLLTRPHLLTFSHSYSLTCPHVLHFHVCAHLPACLPVLCTCLPAPLCSVIPRAPVPTSLCLLLACPYVACTSRLLTYILCPPVCTTWALSLWRRCK
ncbi:hypothetical protein BC628DRAFT_1384425 [Trametes gibbosa]|nr:hypothetical protein BC628DRAFT_1384425 [Trametes gibbosa]